MSKSHPKIYTKPPIGGYGNKQRDLALLKTWPRYWQKGRVKRRQNSFHVYPRIKPFFGPTSYFGVQIMQIRGRSVICEPLGVFLLTSK